MSTQPNPLAILIPPAYGGGQALDAIQLTVAGNIVDRQNIEIATPVNPQRQAFGAQTVGADATGTPMTCSLVSSGLTGYLSRWKLVSTGPCLWTIKSGSTVLGYACSNLNDTYEPPHRFFDQCVAGSAFSATPTSLDAIGPIQVYSTCWFDQF